MFFVYILQCSDQSYYIGHTDDIERRVAEHESGKFSGYTSTRQPVELVFLQSFATRDDAFIAEHKIKKWTRKKKEALIAGQWNELKYLAKKKFN